jgi:hypothetical protein
LYSAFLCLSFSYMYVYSMHTNHRTCNRCSVLPRGTLGAYMDDRFESK